MLSPFTIMSLDQGKEFARREIARIYAEPMEPVSENGTPAAANEEVSKKAVVRKPRWRALLAEFIADHPNNLFMGPGLLAGGTLKSGNTPKKVAYIPFEVFAGCGEEE